MFIGKMERRCLELIIILRHAIFKEISAFIHHGLSEEAALSMSKYFLVQNAIPVIVQFQSSVEQQLKL